MFSWSHLSTHSSRCSIARWLWRPVVDVPQEYLGNESIPPSAWSFLETDKVNYLATIKDRPTYLQNRHVHSEPSFSKKVHMSAAVFFFVLSQPCTLMNAVLTVWTSSGYPHMIYTHGSLGSLEYKSWLVMARSSRWWTCIQIKLSVIWRMIITGGGQWSIWCRSWRLWCRGNWRQEHCYQHVETHELHYLKVDGQEVGL